METAQEEWCLKNARPRESYSDWMKGKIRQRPKQRGNKRWGGSGDDGAELGCYHIDAKLVVHVTRGEEETAVVTIK